jgi:hypothetical protein
MEDLIRNFNSVKECFDKNSSEDILKMNSTVLKKLCIEEKVAFATSLNALNTNKIILERVEIKKAKDHEKAEKRREFLNQVFK